MRPSAALRLSLACALLIGAFCATPAAAGGRAPSAPQTADVLAKATPTTAAQLRGYWVDAFNPGIYTPAQIDALIADATTIRANALIVQTSRRFDCFCNNALFPRTGAAIDPLPFDPLKTLITRAHAAGLQVHAWVNATTLWNSATPPASVGHAYNQHGPSASGENRWLNKRVDGAESVGAGETFIDPANPAAVDYLVKGVTSITSAYDVDGVTLDYIRYPDYNTGSANDWGYSSTSLARFRALTGRSDTPAVSDAQFTQWRRDQVTGLVRRIYLAMYAVDPKDRLSVSGITYGYGPQSVGGWENTATYRTVLQDWRGWIDQGIVDTVATMNYKRAYLSDQAQMFTEWTKTTAAYQGSRQNVVGPGLYLNDRADNVAQAKAVQAAGVGWAGYSYANVSRTAASSSATVKAGERNLLQQALRKSVFTQAVPVPAMTWKTKPTTGHLVGVLARNGVPLDQAEVSLRATASGKTWTTRTDGSGWFGVPGLAPGEYLVTIAGFAGCGVQVVVTAGKVSTVSPSLESCG